MKRTKEVEEAFKAIESSKFWPHPKTMAAYARELEGGFESAAKELIDTEAEVDGLEIKLSAAEKRAEKAEAERDEARKKADIYDNEYWPMKGALTRGKKYLEAAKERIAQLEAALKGLKGCYAMFRGEFSHECSDACKKESHRKAMFALNNSSPDSCVAEIQAKVWARVKELCDEHPEDVLRIYAEADEQRARCLGFTTQCRNHDCHIDDCPLDCEVSAAALRAKGGE